MEQIVCELNDICRTCKIRTTNLHSIFDNVQMEGVNARVDEMLMACTSVQVKSDEGLPLQICDKCLDSLTKAYLFKQQCKESEDSLRAFLKGVQDIDIKHELNRNVDNSESFLIETSNLPNGESGNKGDYIEFLDNNQIILTCRCCSKVFTSIDSLRNHKLTIIYKCKYCQKQYTREGHLRRHEASHESQKFHVCKICNKTITRTDHLKRHLTTHLKEKPYICKNCGRGFFRVDHLESHEIKCKGDRVHICDICNRSFYREDSLEVHKKLHENQQSILPTIENVESFMDYFYEYNPDKDVFDFSPDSNSDDEDNDNGYNENQCLEPQIEVNENYEGDIKPNTKIEVKVLSGDEGGGQEDDTESTHSEYIPAIFKVKRGRGRPRKNSHTIAKPQKNVRRNDSKEETDDETDDLVKEEPVEGGNNVYICSTCNKRFSRPSHLKRHLASHAILKPYSCDICNKTFSRRDHLNQHKQLHNRKVECEICNKVFNKWNQLEKHKAIKHNIGDSVVKKYECNICNKNFTTEKYRDIHVKGHMGEKKFKCRTCDKSFLSKSHLTEHMKFHNEHSKKFLCSECGQRFIRNDYLVIHMRRHRGEKPFKCKFCGKGFPRTTDLTVHERYHTGEKTHLCTICGRGFGRAYNLTVHMRTHTGERPYRCTYCDAAFAQGNDLKAHVRRHTGERFHCELCTESFLMGYLLTQHKRNVHGLNVVSNIRRLQPLTKIKMDTDEEPPITIPLPKPIVPERPDLIINNIQAHINLQLQDTKFNII